MDLGVVAMKGYSTFHKALELKPEYQIEFNVISRIPLFGGIGVLLIYKEYCLSPADKAESLTECRVSGWEGQKAEVLSIFPSHSFLYSLNLMK